MFHIISGLQIIITNNNLKFVGDLFRKMSRTSRLIGILILTTSYFLVEFIIGNVTNSLSLTADSFNMLSDVISQIIGLVSIRITKNAKVRKDLTYGWARAEVLGALVNSVFQLALCFTIVVSALGRFFRPQSMENPKLVIFIGIGGLLVNILGIILCLFDNKKLEKILKKKIKQHENITEMVNIEKGLSEETLKTESLIEDDDIKKKTAKLNMRGVFLHLLGDALGSAGVIIAGLFFWLTDFSHKELIDPIISLIIVAVLLGTSFPLLKSSALILLETPPSNINLDKLRNDILDVEGVIEVEKLHVWQLNELENIGTVQVICSHFLQDIVKDINQVFNNHLILTNTIQTNIIKQHS